MPKDVASVAYKNCLQIPIEPRHRPTTAVISVSALDEDEARRLQADQEHQIHMRKTFHKDKQSRRRSTSAQKRADQEIECIHSSISETEKVQQVYNDNLSAINEAAKQSLARENRWLRYEANYRKM